MTAREIVAALESHGVRLLVVHGRIDLEADAAPPSDLLDALTRSKAEVLAYLAEREAAPAPAPLPPFVLTLSTFAAPTIRLRDARDEPRRASPRRMF